MFSCLTFWEWAMLFLSHFAVGTVGLFAGFILLFIYD